MARHPALRTRYLARGEDVWQQVLVPRPLELTVLDATEDSLDDLIRRAASRPFVLDTELGFRATLVRWTGGDAEDRWELVLVMHHGISDGWSFSVLLRDLGELYRAAITGDNAGLPELTADYVDFVSQEHACLADPAVRRMVRAWADEVRTDLAMIDLPTDLPRTAELSDAGEVIDTALPATLVSAATELAGRRGTTLFAVLLGVLAHLMHELSGQPTIAVSTSLAGRTDTRFDEVVGLFIRVGWLIVPVSGARTGAELIDRAAEAIGRALAQQLVPGAILNDALGEPFRSAPSGRVGLLFANTPESVLELPGLDVSRPRDVPIDAARGELTWAMEPAADGGMSITVEYATDLFTRATVTGWIDRYQHLLRQVVTDSTAPLSPDHDGRVQKQAH